MMDSNDTLKTSASTPTKAPAEQRALLGALSMDDVEITQLSGGDYLAIVHLNKFAQHQLRHADKAALLLMVQDELNSINKR